MNLSRLRKIRIVVSLLFFFSVSFLFLDIFNLVPASYFKPVLYFQFVPSLLSFLKLFGLLSTGFIAVLIFTGLFGRVYCSSVCPLGTLIDILNRLKKRKKKIQKFTFTKPFNMIRYSILVLIIFTLISGTNFGLIFFDPYSNYGKITNSIFKPLLISINNFANSNLEKLGIFWLTPIEFAGVEFTALIFAIVLFMIVLILSYSNGRLFCNSICPVGSLLGLISKFSLYKISINEETCLECGSCEKYCKAGCIDSKNKFIDFSRCISCFDCFDSCPTSGLKYESVFSKKKINKPAESKRYFIKSLGLFSIGFMGFQNLKKVSVYVKSKLSDAKENYSTPPGSKNSESYSSNCTACHLCVSVCPTQVLQPSFLEFGVFNMLTPFMNYRKGYCNYDCQKCSDVCPTGAITSLNLEKKKLVQIGIAKFIKDNCVVYTQKTDCGACAEHCPTKAVHMEPENNLRVPKVEEEICIGCGACEHACPTVPYKAIYVEGNLIHKTAKKPNIKKVEQKINLKEEFPF